MIPERRQRRIAAFTGPTEDSFVYENVSKAIRAVGAMLSSGIVPNVAYMIPPHNDE